MFEEYRSRIARRNGSYMGETMRKQTNMVTDALWMNSVSTRPVQVKVIDSGLPPTYESSDDFEEVLWAHFEENTKFNITKDEVDRFLIFRPGDLVKHPEIHVGAYVCIPDADNILGWWLIVYIDDDNQLRKTHVLRADQVFKWVKDGKIYQCLGCNRVANSYNAGSWDADRTTAVDNIYGAWLPTNNDTLTIGYNQRMLISDERRYPPLAWMVSKIEDTIPVGISKFRFTQETFDPAHDSAELGLANYYDSSVEPIPNDPTPDRGTVTITYSGTKPTIKVGGSFKTFIAAFSDANTTVSQWMVSNESGNITSDMEDYTIEYDKNNNLRLKVAQKYDLIGTVLIIQVIGTDGSVAEVQVEVIG